MKSIREIYKIGKGPSSSHTMGPERAALLFSKRYPDATAFRVADINKTSVCPLAKVMRRELKKRGISHVKVVYSKEEAITPLEEEIESPCDKQDDGDTVGRKKIAPGSISFVPSVAGLIIAGEVIKDIFNI